MQFHPLQSIAGGILIPREAVINAFLIMVVLYSGVVATIGIMVLRRRELALPG